MRTNRKWWLAASLLIVVALAAQDKKSPPNDNQNLDIQKAHLNVMLAQNGLQAAALKLPEYKTLQESLDTFHKVCKAVAKENGWPDGTDCDQNTLQLMAPPSKAPEKK